MVHKSRKMVLYPSHAHCLKLEWDDSMEEKQLKLFSNFYLPFYLGNIEGHEMVSYERNYTRSELEALAGSIYSQFAENLEEKGVHILENDDRIDTSAAGSVISGTLVTEESIVEHQPITEEETGMTIDSEET